MPVIIKDASVAEALANEGDHWRFLNFGGSPQASLSLFKEYLGASPTLHFRLIHRSSDPRLWLWEMREAGLGLLRRLRSRGVGQDPDHRQVR